MAVNFEAADSAPEMAPYARFPVALARPSTAALAALRGAVGEVSCRRPGLRGSPVLFGFASRVRIGVRFAVDMFLPFTVWVRELKIPRTCGWEEHPTLRKC